MDPFMQAALEEAEAGFRESGIPIGAVLVHNGRILGRGGNQRVQRGSPVLHAEMAALKNRSGCPIGFANIRKGTLGGPAVGRENSRREKPGQTCELL